MSVAILLFLNMGNMGITTRMQYTQLKQGRKIFNYTLNTFYLELNGFVHMVKNH